MCIGETMEKIDTLMGTPCKFRMNKNYFEMFELRLLTCLLIYGSRKKQLEDAAFIRNVYKQPTGTNNKHHCFETLTTR